MLVVLLCSSALAQPGLVADPWSRAIERFGLGDPRLDLPDATLPAPQSNESLGADTLACEIEPTPVASWALPASVLRSESERTRGLPLSWVLSEVQDPWRNETRADVSPNVSATRAGELRSSPFGASQEGELHPAKEMTFAEMGQLHQLGQRVGTRGVDSWAIAMDGIVDPWANDGTSDPERLGVELIVDPWRPRH